MQNVTRFGFDVIRVATHGLAPSASEPDIDRQLPKAAFGKAIGVPCVSYCIDCFLGSKKVLNGQEFLFLKEGPSI